MKKTVSIVLVFLICVSTFIGCNQEENIISQSNCSFNNTDCIDNIDESKGDKLVENPSEDYIISCLRLTLNIREVVAVTTDNDPNGKLNTEGAYYSAVYFSSDLIDQEDVSGDDLIEKGTDAGGCIESYKNKSDAELRNEELSKYDDSWLFNAGYHVVVGTIVVRISSKLDKEQQKELAENIIDMLTSGEVSESVTVSHVETATDKETTSQDGTSKIKMEHSDTYYEDGSWSLEKTIDHFKKMGFINVETKVESDFFIDDTVFDIEIDTGWLNEDGFNEGDTFNPEDTVEIYYYSTDFLLTTENCSDLATVLNSDDTDYMTFANKYNGQYVAFDAYVVEHVSAFSGTSGYINVAGGNYSKNESLGHVIRIGDRTWGNNIDKEVKECQNVRVIGKIDSSWCEYYEMLYVECEYLYKR